jgi:ABC-type Na+ transport system ATPase subunit NatA
MTEAVNLTKRFRPVTAVDDLSFSARAGGAGKPKPGL